MSNKQDKIEVEGKIIKTLPGLVFDIQLPEEF
jgi:translation initiation factor IF-1